MCSDFGPLHRSVPSVTVGRPLTVSPPDGALYDDTGPHSRVKGAGTGGVRVRGSQEGLGAEGVVSIFVRGGWDQYLQQEC